MLWGTLAGAFCLSYSTQVRALWPAYACAERAVRKSGAGDGKYADGTGHGRRTSVDRCKEIGRSRRAVPRLYALVLQPDGGGTAARAAYVDETAAS